MDADTKLTESPTSEKATKERSTIEFPYLDEENAFEIAAAVHQLGGECSLDQLAAHINASAQGGGFRLRLICARMFGLITYERAQASLTPLGHRSADPQQQRAAKAESFLNIELYKALFDSHRGVTLPPAAGLEKKMISLGVAEKQADKARQAFQRSAKFAGYFEYGSDRLVAPVTNNQSQKAAAEEEAAQERETSKTAKLDYRQAHQLHPFVQGLIEKLPEPDSNWSLIDRAKWLTTAANIFDLMYASNDDHSNAGVKVTLEGKTLSISREPSP
ncbi:hypothetical protein [Bordetella bronchiseptica]|uniref:hypothetical protein n=1 Tax=Bordetella bronchiseptica TaxID=518 RepID=UPI0012685A24|nr:hypothetical protein [Bordetella bronchiseptica]